MPGPPSASCSSVAIYPDSRDLVSFFVEVPQPRPIPGPRAGVSCFRGAAAPALAQIQALNHTIARQWMSVIRPAVSTGQSSQNTITMAARITQTNGRYT
jgi:hypothetical protein